MCGICGMAFSDGSRTVDRSVLGTMNDALTHRGPDDAGLWTRPGVGLAMRRLSIRDIEGGAQPMANEDESVVVVFNGEIYNTDELRTWLIGRGVTFRTHCDTEVVMRALEAEGEKALHRFNGMFAIGAWFATDNSVLIARDRLGIKPLHYVIDKGVLTFASELDALRASGVDLGGMDGAAVDGYLTYLYIPAPDTIFRHAKKLRPGEFARFKDGELRTERYWRPNYEIDTTWTVDSVGERFLELLDDSVRLRTVSDVPLGAFLSGGVDSSAVVGSLASASNRPVKTFSIGFDDAHANELEYARIASTHFGTDHTEAIMRPDMVDLVSRLVSHFGEPFADSSALPTWLVSQIAREQVTVALSGDGGDELFAGYTWTRMNHAVAAARYVPSFMRRAMDAALFFVPRKGPTLQKVRRFNLDTFMEPYVSFKRRHTCLDADARGRILGPAIRQEAQQAARDRFAETAETAGDISPDDWMLYMDTSMYLPDDILTKVDRMSMAHGLEARVPLLDHRMVEFAATVPFDLKLNGGTTKYAMKRALRSRLPKELLRQRKQGFSIPIHRWLREDLAEMFQDTVIAQGARCHEYIEVEEAKRLWAQHAARDENHGHALWALLILETWLRDLEV